MADVVILLAVKKIGIALGNEAINQAISQFKKFITQITELQGSMGRIRRELRLMHEFLCRMDVRNRNNQAYEVWVQDVRMLVHGIQDIVDDYLHLVGRKHDTGWGTYLKKGFKRPNVLLSLNRIAASVKEAEHNLEHLFQAKDRWVSMASGGSSSDNSSYIVERSQHLANISRSISDEDLVGVDDDRKVLMQWLEDGGLGHSVIAIDGMGGLGKTALAANVYKKARRKFKWHAWVSISQNYSREDVLKFLMDELNKDRRNTPGNNDLKEFLQDKKYLIVLDDVWAPEAVNDLFGALVQNHKGSRILVTTRNDDVAHLVSRDRRITLKPLSEKDSCQLFCKTAFPRETNHECPRELKQLADQIINKCEGIPLAIVSVGRLLSVRDKTKEELKRIHDQLDWELINNPSLEHVRNILYLSYIYLPTQLKSCFLYCSLFPEDYLLQRKRLIRLWIAEGFIEKKGESTLEEVAEGYLNELVHRKMLLLIRRNSFGRIKSLRMHDIVRDLAVDLCQRECFGVAYQEDKCGGESLEEKDGRRLVIHKLNSDIQQSISSIHHLRSVITLDSGIPSSTLLSSVSKNSRYMLVLELSGLPIETVPDAIGDLFNLRHLGLRDSKVKLLPKSIEKLSNLLTLDLCRSDIQELPRGIVKLKKLRHLFAEKASDRTGRDFRCHSGVSIPKGLANLIDLQTLQALEAQDESVGQLGDLRQLRSIRIQNVKRVFCERLCEYLVQMRFLSNLDLAASDENEVLELNHLDPLPPNLQKLGLRGQLAEGTFGESPLFQTNGQNLYSLHLNWSQLREDPLPCLSRLSSLTNLWLTSAYSGEQLVFLARWFPMLKKLTLRDLPNLKQLEIQQGAMASLEELSLVNLSSMTEVPPGIEFLKLLQYLRFEEITPEFLTLLQHGLDDVWAPEAVDDFFGALVQNLKGSRILVTTRIDDVAHLAFQDRRITLEPLSKKESCELFCKMTFPRETNHECPMELKQLADQIINKCEGIPLAIVSVGRLLSVRDKTKEELKRIHDQLDWELINNPSLEHVRNILYLSYIYLPTQLKSCFLYCSLFPEDYLLKRKRLVRLWIAEGFIEKKGKSTPEEVAEGYLNELVHRNMLQLNERNSFGRAKSFRMHDIVRDLAVDLCQRECFGVAYQEDKYGGESLEEKDGRRLVIHKLKSDIQLSISSIHHLRSIITLDSGIPSSTLLSSVSKNSRYMSVLELSGLPIETVPDAIGDLFNLHHLGLRGSKVKLLPMSIEKLSNLLTLDLCKSDIQELPRGIVKLKKLRHLFAEKASDRTGRYFRCRSGVSIPKGLANLKDLQTLQALEAQDESVGELGDLRQLRSIRIWNVKRVLCERLCASLVQMRFLSNLDLAASNENEVLQLNDLDPLPPNLQKLALRGRLVEEAFGESPLFQANGQNLYSLCLTWCQLREDPLSCLSRLSSLTDLSLTRAYSGEQLVFLTRWFPMLKKLTLRDLPNLKRLEIQQGVMASLEESSLINLSSMTEVPPGIEFLKLLQYLGFEEITPEFLTLLHECPRIGGMRWWYSLRD